MFALQLDKTQITPFLVEALDGAHIKYTKMNYPRNFPLLLNRCGSLKWAGSWYLNITENSWKL